jgi:serine/threonine protein kinase
VDAVALKTLFSVLDSRRTGADTALNLPGADLRGAHLMCADLQRANFGQARLDRCNLAGAKLAHASLAGASMGSTDLTGADLRGADLSGAALAGALLTAADLRGAKLSQISGEPASVAGARIDLALCERSGFEEVEIIKLAVAGARIDELSGFSQAVREACASTSVPSGPKSGPRSRGTSDADASSRRHRTSMPSSSRSAQSLTMPEVGEEPPRSVRFSRGWAGDIDDSPFGDTHKPMPLRRVRKPGDLVLGVTLLSRIGSGSSSTVWRGTESDGTAVAVKLFEPPPGEWVAAHAAFLRGMRAMTRLPTSGKPLPKTLVIIRRSGAGGLDLVTDFAEKGNIGNLYALGWPPRKTIAFFEELCRAIAFAHDAGVMHRCLKPSNILLSEKLAPIVTDFDMVDLPSLARGPDARAGGYAAYAAPEALSGESTDSPSADIFSLGKILYFLLSGREPPEWAQAQDMRPLPQSPPGTVGIIRKCTLRDPALRYQRVSDLIADLSRCAEAADSGQGSSAPADPPLSPRETPPTVRSRSEIAAPLRPAPAPPPRSRDAERSPPPSQAKRAASAPTAARAGSTQERASPPPPAVIAASPSADADPHAAALSGSILPRAAVPSRMSRRAEIAIALLGALMLGSVASMLAVVRAPGADMLRATRITGSIAVAMTSFVIPRAPRHPMLARALLAIVGAMLFYLLDLARS